MIFSPVNLQDELIRERMRQQRIMNDVHDLFDAGTRRDQEVLDRLAGRGRPTEPQLALDAADLAHVFTLDQIRQTCIRFRLRFLDTRFFRSEFPYDAVLKIRAFEERYNIRIERFRIAAPDHAFKLENINKDPLLFAELADGRYYLLHQWGEDLAWYKRFLLWPLQNLKTFLLTILSISFLISFLIPSAVMHVFTLQSEIYLRIWFGLHLFIGFTGIGLWAGISFDTSFSSMSWNSQYRNY